METRMVVAFDNIVGTENTQLKRVKGFWHTLIDYCGR